MKILVVDDNGQTATSISRMVEFWGNSTTEAYNVEDAIKAIKEEHPDLIIQDIVMEPKNGYEVIKAAPGKKFIVMSGFKFDEKELKKYKNIMGRIKKPVDPEELEKIIKKLK